QYIVVRRDLQETLGWPSGAVMAQACHAATAAIHLFYSNPDTEAYLADLDRMHKVVLGASSEAELTSLSQTLTANGVEHKLWIEQPENYPTALAVRPYNKTDVQALFKQFKMLK
ncbi:hypothetical protein BOX15_Mlig017504g1, partial [Macrostomum lignano]